MKHKLFLSLIMAFLLCSNTFAQVATITGTVVDELNEPLLGVSVIVKHQPGIGTQTDLDGNFQIKAATNETLVFNYLGYEPKEVAINGKTSLGVVQIVPSETTLEEVTVVGAGVQRKVSVVGAITSVDVATLKVPTASLSNALAGNVAGIIAMQTSGEPGQNFSEFWIRGISTFGANASALVLVDGVERNLNELNVEDIESFSVLKDASATAIYGQRGANGVIVVTTKKGQEGKVNINFKGEYGLRTPSRTVDYVDAVKYAELANEARSTRGQNPIYSDSEMEIIRYNLDPDLYPNVDWYDEVMKDITSNYRASINISGGSKSARYFISGSYYSEEGMYKVNNLNKYNTNSNYDRYNFRSNIDVNLTETTEVSLNLSGFVVNRNKPGGDADTDNINDNHIWNSIAGLTPLTVPVLFSDGLFPTYGTGASTNPKVLLTEMGYKTYWENKMEASLGVKQNFDFITPGLSASARFSFDAFNWNRIYRLKNPDLYRAEKQRDGNGQLIRTRVLTASPLAMSSSAGGERRYFGEANINYDQVFNDVHRVSGLFRFTTEEVANTAPGSDVFGAVPHRYLAYAGRATYSYDDRYFVEGNIGYTGSENFEKGKRFGLFPAVAVGWMLSNESFIRSFAEDWLDQLKVRYSYGLTGNDALRRRFPYMTTITQQDNFRFGDIGQNTVSSYYINQLGANGLTWETSTKHNFGIDLGLFNKFNFTMDFFRDDRENIFMVRGHIPYTVGLEGKELWANVGHMRNQGMDGQGSFVTKIGNVDLTLRGNITYSYTNVIEYDEAANALEYQMTKGYRWNQSRGLLSLGLFKDEEDIQNSPEQQFGVTVLPGDIKYKDVNGDGVVNEDDVVPFGYTTTPGLVYGFGASASWNNFDFNILMQGAGNQDFFLGGIGVGPFIASDLGNILTVVADEKDRWISREISNDPSTERTDATFPRLSYGSNDNNFRNSDFWLRNTRYLRLKNLEIGYTVPKKVSRMWLMDAVRVYAIGNNLAVFSPFKWWDPELNSPNGARYPISKSFTLGVTVSF